MLSFLEDAWAFLKMVLGLAALAAVSIALHMGCAELNSTDVPCDPQTAVDRCEPELGTYMR